MKILVDRNLSPDWCDVLRKQGWTCVHRSQTGDPRAADRTIMNGAVDNGYVVFTHDLDFGAILAATQGKGPSVIQVRVRDILPSSQEGLTVGILGGHEADLEKGSIVVVEAFRARVRVLPLTRQEPPASQE